MKPVLLTFALALAFHLTAATLPNLEGQTLAGSKLSLPTALKGKTALFIIGFSKDSQKQTEAWGKRLTTDLHTLEVWSVVDLEAAPRLIRPMILRAMRASMPKPRHDYFFILTKGGKTLRPALAYDSRAPQNDDAYLVLIDAAGNITWQFHGPVSEAAVTALRPNVRPPEGARGSLSGSPMP